MRIFGGAGPVTSKRWLAVYVVMAGLLGLCTVGARAARAATLGKSTIGASDGGGLLANVKRVNQYPLSVPASVSKLSVYLSPAGPAGSQVMEGVIYADSGGSPGALVAQSRQISFASTSRAGWYDLPFAGNVALSPGGYWLGIYTGASSTVAAYRYDPGPSTRARLANDQTYTTGGASDPFGAVGWSDKNEMSLYATYTTPAWAIQAVPAPTGSSYGQLAGVACPSTAACFGVGDLGEPGELGGTATTLAERRNGSSWSRLTTPNPTRATKSVLSAVACSSATACTAVGWSGTDSAAGTLAERWNGSSWTVQTTPNPAGGTNDSLNSVSCPASTACTAVGGYTNASGTQVALAERWNGSSWVMATVPIPAGKTDTKFNSLSCPSSTACTAVGFSDDNGPSSTLAERWNGSSWTIQTTPTLAGALNGVSCPTTTACTAVGSSASDLTLAERWNGSSWSIQPTQNPAGAASPSLTSVSCPSATLCTAVGYSYDSSTPVGSTLAERWNGSSWSIQPTPNPAPASQKESQLDSVSCPSSTDCAAVGSSTGLTPDFVPELPLLAERYW